MARFKLKRRWLLMAGFGLIALVTVVFVAFLSAPSHGRQTSVDVKFKPTPASKPKLAPASTLSNAYFNLALPAGYSTTSQSNSTAGLLWNGTIIKSSSDGSQVISIGIKNFSGDLSDDSSYKLRQQSPAYQMQVSRGYGGQIIIFTKADGSSGEATAFWVNGSRQATISVTEYSATDSKDCLQTLNNLLGLWHWQA